MDSLPAMSLEDDCCKFFVSLSGGVDLYLVVVIQSSWHEHMPLPPFFFQLQPDTNYGPNFGRGIPISPQIWLLYVSLLRSSRPKFSGMALLRGL